MHPQSAFLPKFLEPQDYNSRCKVLKLPIPGYHIQITPLDPNLSYHGLLLIESVCESAGMIVHYWIAEMVSLRFFIMLAIASAARHQALSIPVER